MSDAIKHAQAGPDAMWSQDLPPSRGQYETIATLALELLEVEKPKTRFEASVAITRLHQALLSEHAPRPKVPLSEPF